MESHIHILHRESEEDISSFSPHSYPFSFFFNSAFYYRFFFFLIIKYIEYMHIETKKIGKLLFRRIIIKKLYLSVNETTFTAISQRIVAAS